MDWGHRMDWSHRMDGSHRSHRMDWLDGAYRSYWN